jgi:hypothetical protein
MKQCGSDEYKRSWTTKHQSLLGNVFPAALFSRRSLFPAAPVAGPASVMGEGDHSKLFAMDVVNDAVREFS